MIAGLLDHTRVHEPDLQSVGFDDWLGEVLDEQTVPDGVVLERNFGAPAAVVQLDADRFRRVIINLFENACQAMLEDEGSGERRLSFKTTGGDGSLHVSIADTGPGIPADALDKIFEPLFTTRRGGIGLGLPTVQEIIERHGGGIDIKSRPGDGTRAEFWLPLALAKGAAA